jgi:2-polyprenyl-3-methyl-5-hydroxy-6-metoxy-1,4-benzoquinol methylase
MKHHDYCPVCGSADISILFTAKDHMVSGASFPVAGCITCKARFTQDVPDESAIGLYYKSEAYISHTDTRKGMVNRLYHLVRNYTLQAKRKSMRIALGRDHGSILDYGCGTGAFLGVMKAAGWAVTGIEPDADARQLARSAHGVEAREPAALKAMPDESFDIITLWHVLEHVYDLQETLRHLHRVLKPGGHIFIAVPNHTAADAAHYGAFWAAWDVPRHLYHFAPSSMKMLLEKHGFRMQELKAMWFDSFYVSMLSERYRHREPNLVSAAWYGLRSNISAVGHPDRCSSVVYHAMRN